MPINGERLGPSPIVISSRRGFHFLLVLLALPLLLGAKVKTVSGPVLYSDGIVQVVSQDKLGTAECKEAAKMVNAAWKFDLNVMRWSDSPGLHRPLTLQVNDTGRMKKENPGMRAITPFNGKSFIIRADLVNDPSGPITCAHELGHMQAFRVLGEKRAGKHLVPLYFIEGHGLIMNRLYADHLRISSPKDWTKNVGTVMSLSPEEASVILTDDSYSNNEKNPDKTFKMESLGVYFVEYMRTRYQGKGIPDMVPKMGRVFELVARGKTYEQAFKQVYGVSVNQAVSEIVDLFKRTQANPAERCKGTRFEVASQILAGKSRK
jgi:hypothetical protein